MSRRLVFLGRVQIWVLVLFLALIAFAGNWVSTKRLSRTPLHQDPAKRSKIAAPNQVYDPSTGDSNFEARCSAAGVIKCVGFDSPAELSGGYGNSSGVLPTSSGSRPMVDTTVKASGKGSLKFTIPPKSGPDSSGAYFTNFSNDLSSQFDSGGEFYIQWRQRFTREFIATLNAQGDGWKQAIITEGDRPGISIPSCVDIGVIVQNLYNRGFPRLYHSCGVKDQQYEPLHEPIGSPPTDFYLENGVRKPGCLYTLVNSGRPYIPPCMGYKPDQWMTFQMHIKVGTWYRNNGVYKHDSTVQLWIAEERKPSGLAIDFSPHDPSCSAQQVSVPPCQTGYDLVRVNTPEAKFGKIWLTPYNTGKNPAVSHPVAYTWYDELIISTNKVADPQ